MMMILIPKKWEMNTLLVKQQDKALCERGNRCGCYGEEEKRVNRTRVCGRKGVFI
jgi:hypothetical protein